MTNEQLRERLHNIRVPSILREHAANLSGFLGKTTTTKEAERLEVRIQEIRQLADTLEETNTYKTPPYIEGLREQLGRAETKVENLHGALQAALLPLERAADALVPEARVAEAAGLVEEALAAIREELE